MTNKLNHSWNLNPQEAIALQNKLKSQLKIEDDFKEIKILAGADAALSQDQTQIIAGIILYHYPSLEEIERVYAVDYLTFPYIPGLLTFREGAALIQAFEKLKQRPNLVLFDGQGIAHPRRLGIASHMGLYLDIPSIGVGKSRLCGTYEEPGEHRGDASILWYYQKQIGVVLRTRDRVKPLFISPGHRISLATAVQIVLHCHDGTRIPKPTREADRYVATLKIK